LYILSSDLINWADRLSSKFCKEWHLPISEEAKQIARLGLVESAFRFDDKPEFDDSKKVFKAFAFPRIKGRILRDYLGAWASNPPKYGILRDQFEAECSFTYDDDIGSIEMSCDGIQVKIEHKDLVFKLFNQATLTNHQRQVVIDYFFNDINLEEQAKAYGVNPRPLSCSKRRALNNLLTAYQTLHNGSTSL
jgi:DNA-directed RNA polymerase specialized sigma subunit